MSNDPIMKPPAVEARKVAIASASSPVNLGVLGGGTLGTVALVLSGHPMLGIMVLALGVLAYGALVGLDMFNPKFIRQVYEQGDLDAALRAGDAFTPEILPDEIEPDELRATYQAILGSYTQVHDAVGAGGGILQRSLIEANERCAFLVREAGQMARRGNALHRYLARERPRAIEADAERLEGQARSTRDQAAAQSFRQAAQAKRQQLETYLQIEGLYDRIKAQLSVIQTSLDGVHARVVKLNATDPEKAATLGASLSEHLGALQTDMQVLETTVDETIKELSL
ncbi:MAG TPA: hypothetical protein VNM90_24000 [Haliangium sp.]|nr:hypothetical protein [Haliangium sp.]